MNLHNNEAGRRVSTKPPKEGSKPPNLACLGGAVADAAYLQVPWRFRFLQHADLLATPADFEESGRRPLPKVPQEMIYHLFVPSGKYQHSLSGTRALPM